MIKKVLLALLIIIPVSIGAGYLYFQQIEKELPQILKVEDYKPLLVSYIYARGGEKIGTFTREKRILTPFNKIPKHVVDAFLSAEDDTFYEHEGINYVAILRAFMTNIKAGRTKQGGSTITQQVAKTFFLNRKKEITRKIKEAMLAKKLEEHLSKEDILYLYLNQIFFGKNSYGVAAAADTYFRKPLDQISIAEGAMLAGLVTAPSANAPTNNPAGAKDRQRYVISRMVDTGAISEEQGKQAVNEPITVYMEEEGGNVAPYFIETVRQILVEEIGEEMLLDGGVKIYTSLDYKAQMDATKQSEEGLKALDKRQGYRGPVKNLTKPEEIDAFLLATRKTLERKKAPVRIITADGGVMPDRPLVVFQKKDETGKVVSNLPEYLPVGKSVEGIVTAIDDRWGVAYVRFGESQGIIDLEDMSWARKPDPNVASENAPAVKKVSLVLKAGDVILVKVKSEVAAVGERLQKEMSPSKKRGVTDPNALKDLPKFEDYAQVTLDQEPMVEAALLSFDQNTQDIVAMVGGKNYDQTKFNRAVQAFRQTGSAFKAIIYLSALDRGWHAGRVIADAPIVFEEKADKTDVEAADGQEDIKKWKPHNYGNKFEGDMLFRQALIQSLNIPTVKILEDIGIPWAIDYSRRLGIFSSLNNDLSLSLGSSGVTLYEMTKVFSHIGRLGKRIRPTIIQKVLDTDGNVVREAISLDKRFEKEIAAVDQYFAEKRKAASAAPAQPTPVDGQQNLKPTIPPIYFDDPDQLIRPSTAYLMTNMLGATITDELGTAARARALGRPAAGKTGTTNGYFDTWFIGYTPQYVTGVWVGFDKEMSLGTGEAGGRTALPIWLEYMKNLHQNIPPTSFNSPEGIVFANIDKKTGKLASSRSKEVVNQAFLAGTEPKELSESTSTKEEADFYKEDLSE